MLRKYAMLRSPINLRKKFSSRHNSQGFFNRDSQGVRIVDEESSVSEIKKPEKAASLYNSVRHEDRNFLETRVTNSKQTVITILGLTPMEIIRRDIVLLR